jgi:hypothetical protein
MRKELVTSRIVHDQASKESVSRLFQKSKFKSYHHPTGFGTQISVSPGKTHKTEDFKALHSTQKSNKKQRIDSHCGQEKSKIPGDFEHSMQKV